MHPVAVALFPSSVSPWLAHLPFRLGLVLAAPVAGRGEEIDDLVMARARRGDHQAFGEIVGCYDERLRALAYRLLDDRDRMDDVLQEAYVKAYRGLPQFKGTTALGTWLYRITYNACMDELRPPRAVLAGEDDVDRPSLEPGPGEVEVQRCSLAAALKTLPAAPVAAPPQARHHRSRRARPTTLLGVAAAVVVAAVLVAGVVLRPGDVPGRLGPQVASAAEVRTRVAEALSELSTLRGEVTVECAIASGSCYPPEEGGRTALSWTFVTTAEGNERVTGVGRLDDLAYRADDGVQRSITDQFDMVSAEEVSGLPPGPPDFAARDSVLRRDVADPGVFELELPADASPFRQDVGFRRMAIEEVAATVGYQPLLPAAVPAGFELAEVTVAEEAQPTGAEAANPPSEDVVSVAYRRGFDRIAVTTRATGPYQLAPPDGTGTVAGWDDPLASGEGFFDEAEPFTVATGALAGAEAELVISSRGTPHVWTFRDDLVTTVAGDASAEDLRRMVESFRPAP